jgi:hypothetical protein
MSWFIVDVEADGKIIGEHSMVCFGAVKLSPDLDKTFYGQTKPISEIYQPEALAISGFKREEHEKFDLPYITMSSFANWLILHSKGTPVLLSDNNGFDAAWINYYFMMFHGSNPFGWTSRRIGDLFCGSEHDLHYKWKQHRITEATHNPVDDAKGNAEALLYWFNKYNIKLPK